MTAWLQTEKTRIAAGPVTNRQWMQYIQDSGYAPNAEDHDGDYLKHWVDGKPKEEDLSKPVTWVSWVQARKFCEFYGWRLPTLEEMWDISKDLWEWVETSVSCRGGSFINLARNTRCALRDGHPPQYCFVNVGFRPAKDVESQTLFCWNDRRNIPGSPGSGCVLAASHSGAENPMKLLTTVQTTTVETVPVPRDLLEWLREDLSSLLAERDHKKTSRYRDEAQEYKELRHRFEQVNQFLGGLRALNPFKADSMGVSKYTHHCFYADSACFSEQECHIFETTKKTEKVEVAILRHLLSGYTIAWPPSCDLMARLHAASGRRWRLNDVGHATVGAGKSGTGADAVSLFAEGRHCELHSYCLGDVALALELYDHAKQHGHLVVPGGVKWPIRVP